MYRVIFIASAIVIVSLSLYFFAQTRDDANELSNPASVNETALGPEQPAPASDPRKPDNDVRSFANPDTDEDQRDAARRYVEASGQESLSEAVTLHNTESDEIKADASNPEINTKEMDNKVLPPLKNPESAWTNSKPLSSPELAAELSGDYRGNIIMNAGEVIPTEYSLQGEMKESGFMGQQTMTIQRLSGSPDSFSRSGSLEFIRVMPDGHSILFDDGVPFKGNSASRIFHMKAIGAKLIGKYYLRNQGTGQWELKGSIDLSKD